MGEQGDRYRRVESLYQSALDEPPERRLPFIRDACSGDEALRSEVEALLRCYEVAKDRYLCKPAHALSSVPATAEALPRHIGRFRILERLGEGGMGVVYRAEQENPKRQVALKAIRPGVVRADSLRRFELEAAILGRLKHPGIAQVYEAGMDEGPGGRRPFFAMELVEGLPLLAFVRQHELSIRDKLELFARICDAAQYAHQKGVIHRDLKPGNILVVEEGTEAQRHEKVGTEARRHGGMESEEGAEAQRHKGTEGMPPSCLCSSVPSCLPKILDFGVARVTDSDLQATTMHTDIGQVVGTLPYMSPEQVAGDVREIDTRADVYALGVILYELLTGRLPFDVVDKTIAAAARLIVEEEPAPPSSSNRSLRGDLNTIALKALEKEPERRYQSASDLAAEIRRFLGDEPIAARPRTTLYQLRKFARRNRGLVAGGAAALVVLVVGAAVSTTLAIGQSRALAESERQRRIAQAVNDFLNQDLLANANPIEQPDRDISLREVLDQASESITGRFQAEPQVEAAIRTTLSETYKGLGEFEKSGDHAQRSLQLLRTTRPETDPEVLMAMSRLASAEHFQGRWKEADRIFREALQIATQAHGEEHETTLTLMNNLGLLLTHQERFHEAESLLKRVVDRRIRLLGEEHHHTMTSINNLAGVYVALERFDEAERLHLKEIEAGKRVRGPEHPETLLSINNLAVLYSNRGQPRRAEPLMRQVYETRNRLLGPDHPSTLESADVLAGALQGIKRNDEALALIQDTLARREKVLGPEHPKTLNSRDRLANLYYHIERLDEAETLARANLATRKRVLGEEHGSVGASFELLFRICLKQGKLDEAAEMGRRGYEIFELRYGPTHSRARRLAKWMSELSHQRGLPDDAQEWEARAVK